MRVAILSQQYYRAVLGPIKIAGRDMSSHNMLTFLKLTLFEAKYQLQNGLE